MARLKLFDSTGDTCTTTGTGTLTGLGTAPTGYQTPSSGGVADADNTVIRIEVADDTTWEVCETVYTASGTTWSRGTLIASSTGSRINFPAGTKNIKCCASKELLSAGVLSTTGDILYHDGTKGARLAIGASTTVLHGGTTPSYSQIVNSDITASTINLTTKVTGVLPEANGGTNQSTYATGDIVSATGTNTLGVIAVGATGTVLKGGTTPSYGAPYGMAIYGNGSDAAQTFDGSTTILGLAPSSNAYTLTRDIYLADGSSVASPAIIKTGGFRIFCNGTLTINSGGTIQNNGNNASGTTAGAAGTNGTIRGGSAGGAGRTTVGAGNTGTNVTISVGTAGGAGGSDGGSNAGGAAGTVTAVIANSGGTGIATIYPHCLSCKDIGGNTITCSTGGGGGGLAVATVETSGAGGGGGGFVVIAARNLVNNGTISSNGGNGSNAALNGGSASAGGGGGGAGGVVILLYNTFSGNVATVTAGTKGTKVGSGVNGSDGSAGVIISLQN